jgi:hypothetical protein
MLPARSVLATSTPSQSVHPDGIVDTVPYHKAIKPIGTSEFVTPFTVNESAFTLPFTFSLKPSGSFVPIPMLPAKV